MTAVSFPEYDKVNSVCEFPGSERATAGFVGKTGQEVSAGQSIKAGEKAAF
jgi:hypothetical protein